MQRRVLRVGRPQAIGFVEIGHEARQQRPEFGSLLGRETVLAAVQQEPVPQVEAGVFECIPDLVILEQVQLPNLTL